MTPATGGQLDSFASLLGVYRKPGRRLWWTLWLLRSNGETDKELRSRCQSVWMAPPSRQGLFE